MKQLFPLAMETNVTGGQAIAEEASLARVRMDHEAASISSHCGDCGSYDEQTYIPDHFLFMGVYTY